MEHFMRIVHETGAQFFILENVAYMSRANLAVFDELTRVRSIVLNARDFLPQWRQRRFWCNFSVVEDSKGYPFPTLTLSDILVADCKRQPVHMERLASPSPRRCSDGLFPERVWW